MMAALAKTLAATAALLTLAGPARSAEPRSAFCQALDTVAGKALATGEPVFVTFVKGREMDTYCFLRPSDAPLQHQYCDAASEAAGIEFSHRYPWLIQACLKRQSVFTEVNAHAYTGYVRRGRTEHLAGRLPNGVRVDVRYVPDEEGPPDPKDPYWGYDGRYVMTLWAPKAGGR